jgi:hypothetical protein
LCVQGTLLALHFHQFLSHLGNIRFQGSGLRLQGIVFLFCNHVAF